MFSFGRIYRWFFPERKQIMTQADLEDLDVAVQYPLTMLDQEKFVVEAGELAATSAIFSEGTITLTDGRSLDG
jgi:hypothetical protein